MQKASVSRTWGRSKDKMGCRGAPARQYASSTLSPWARSVFKAALQLSLPPCGVTRMVLRGLSRWPNFCFIWPSWVRNFWVKKIRMHLNSHKSGGKKNASMLSLGTLVCCLSPATGWMMSLPQNITLSCSNWHKAVCWSSSAARRPGSMTGEMNHNLTSANDQHYLNQYISSISIFVYY